MFHFFKWLKKKLVATFKWTWKQLKDKTNLIIYIIVNIVVSSEVWVPYLLAVITGNKWWWGIGSACWAFWIGPFTPFSAICIGITVGVRKVYDKFKKQRKKKKELKDDDKLSSGDNTSPADSGRESVQGTQSKNPGKSAPRSSD